jgi:hypothetical protein
LERPGATTAMANFAARVTKRIKATTTTKQTKCPQLPTQKN